jgi:hypothetical protein
MFDSGGCASRKLPHLTRSQIGTAGNKLFFYLTGESDDFLIGRSIQEISPLKIFSIKTQQSIPTMRRSLGGWQWWKVVGNKQVGKLAHRQTSKLRSIPTVSLVQNTRGTVQNTPAKFLSQSRPNPPDFSNGG